MKWFKHISDSLQDPDIYSLIEKYGGNGYLIFFGTLEIYAREYKPEPGWKLVVSLSYLKRNFGLTHYKLLLNCLKTIHELGRFHVEVKDDKVSVFIPKFRDFMDEWTTRKIGSKSGVTPKILKHDTEVEVDIKKESIKKVSSNFKELWKNYPNKDGKKTAERYFTSSVKTEQDWQDINKALKNYLQSDNVKKGFIKNGSTWFNNWRDWIDYTGIPGKIEPVKPPQYNEDTHFLCIYCHFPKPKEQREHGDRGEGCSDCIKKEQTSTDTRNKEQWSKMTAEQKQKQTELKKKFNLPIPEWMTGEDK